ncbi:MAG: hypothetical protein FJZ00_09565 [Candidatus Sericytochromatia bacterium]|uniref:Cytochrome c domain-containing protein n=1 Tax=Candidatus Tanganyikabacteria bacterium TaxID=2961651 RepID=A0A938BNQ6_9BACT|nr:hypothetical protein [Candidatus Tanganyikabacteria bacterium]
MAAYPSRQLPTDFAEEARFLIPRPVSTAAAHEVESESLPPDLGGANTINGGSEHVKIFRIMVAGVVLVARSMIASEDPPPEHVQLMKDLGKQMGEMRKGVNVDGNATAMADTLKKVAAFWKGRNSEIAMQSCRTTRRGAVAVSKAAGDKAAIAEGMKMIGAGCKGCHDQHREKLTVDGKEVNKIK